MSAPPANNTINRRVNTFDVYIGNLPSDSDQRKIGKLFSKYGEIHNIWITSATDGSKYGLVKFYCEEDSLKAIEETNGMIFEGGKPILARKATKRTGGFLKKDGEGTKEGEDIKLTWPGNMRNPDIGVHFPETVPVLESGGAMPMKRDTEKVLVSFVETPIAVWGQKLNKETIDELANITDQLALICPEAPRITDKPENDKVYGAQYSEDDCWYRCMVRYTYAPDKVKVQYIDFGNTEEVNPANLVELPKSLAALPPCAMKLVLHSLWCNNIQDPLGIAFLKELIEGKEVDAYTTARLSDQTGFFAEVFIDNVYVNEKMLENNFAFRKPGIGAKGRNPASDEGNINTSQLGFKGGQYNLRDGARKFEHDKDEISSLRWKLKNLQSEYTSLSNKAHENGVSTQLKNLTVLSNMVRKLRHQFPIDRDTPLDEAATLLKTSQKIDVSLATTLPEVISAISACKAAQDDILQTPPGEQLEDKIDKRNRLRRELHDKLNTAIDELNQVPLLTRGSQVQTALKSLNDHFDSFLKLPASNGPPITSLMLALDEWKTKKREEIVEARKNSDKMEAAVKAAFTHLQKQILINCEPPAENCLDLDETMAGYTKALQEEIAVADAANTEDAAAIASLVQALHQELSEESQCINHLTNVLQEFTALREQVSPWLNAKPSTLELQAVTNKLKSLKSKLRHKLADKIDAEENQDVAELETIAQDLEDIRGQIHKALKEEDRLVVELTHLATTHFPELLSAQSDSGLNAYMEHKGLIKPSYVLDHYTLTSIGSNSSGIYVSSFDGEPIIIKESFLKSGNHLDKTEFVNQLVKYSTATSTSLQPISAVFFDKNERHAYIQVRKQGELLSQYMESATLTKQQCQSIVRSLIQALRALHQSHVVHGQIQPEFILVDQEGNAVLLPPDFSLSEADRCRSRYTASSGLDFLALDMRQGVKVTEASPAVDVYCLGLLALWLHFPNTRIPERKDGTLDLSQLPLERRLGNFLMKLLCPNPMLRPPTEACLMSEYVSLPILPDLQVQERPPQLMQVGYGNQDHLACGPNRLAPEATPHTGLAMFDSTDTRPTLQLGVLPPQRMTNTSIPPPPFPAPSLNPHQLPAPVASHELSTNTSCHLDPTDLSAAQYQPDLACQFSQQQEADVDYTSCGPVSDHSSTFEIGTFDPTAYEVVMSPQPPDVVRRHEESGSIQSGNHFPDADSDKQEADSFTNEMDTVEAAVYH